MKTFSTFLTTAFAAATLAFNAKGAEIYWTVDDDFVNNINGKIGDVYNYSYVEFLSITVYLFSFDYYSNELQNDLNSWTDNIKIDVGQAYSSISLWEYDEEDSNASVFAEATVEKFYADSIPFENDQNQVVLLTVLQYKGPDESKLHGIIGINPQFGYFDLNDLIGDPNALPDDDNPLVLGDGIFEWPFNGTFEIIPEPATGLLAIAGTAAFLLRRKKRK